MSRARLLPIMACVVAVALIGASWAQSAEGAKWPEFSDKPALGLRARFELTKAKFTAGENLTLKCTVTNVTDEIKPLGWGPWGGLFWMSHNDKFPPRGGRGARATHLSMLPPMTIRPGLGSGLYILYLPPGETLTFWVDFGKTETPGKFKRWFWHKVSVYDSASFSVDQFERQFKERRLCSDLLEYEVIPRVDEAAGREKAGGARD